MREIKFRAWDKKHKQMLCLGDGDHWRLWEKHGWLLVNTVEDEHVSLRHTDGILMQYTGLKDKNEREIYDGDVIAATEETFDGTKVTTNGLITWEHSLPFVEFASQATALELFDKEDVEIIGNIYENPELLK